MVTLRCGKYRVRLKAESAFTIGEVHYGDALIATPSGAQGTVILTERGKASARNPDFQGDPWIGTGHGGEIVHDVTCTVDGRARPLSAEEDIVGERIVVEKVHKLYKFDGRATLVLTPDGWEERQELRAREDVADLHNLYFFMHPWVTSTETWLAGYDDGSEESGEFGENRSISLHRNYEYQPQWFALHDPARKHGVLQFTPRRIPGSSLVQVRPNYHKHYTVLPVRGRVFKAGDVIAHSMSVKVLEDETGDWSATRRAVAGEGIVHGIAE
jgi:hypothetical protein